MNKDEKKAYRRIINDTADHILIGVHKEAFNITDAVYKELLTALRQKIDAILEGGQHEWPSESSQPLHMAEGTLRSRGDRHHQAQAYCMNGRITDKSKPSTLPEKGDIIRITSTPERNSAAEVGNTYVVYSSSRQDNGVIYLHLATNESRIQRPFRSTDYTWVIVKRKWS